MSASYHGCRYTKFLPPFDVEAMQPPIACVDYEKMFVGGGYLLSHSELFTTADPVGLINRKIRMLGSRKAEEWAQAEWLTTYEDMVFLQVPPFEDFSSRVRILVAFLGKKALQAVRHGDLGLFYKHLRARTAPCCRVG